MTLTTQTNQIVRKKWSVAASGYIRTIANGTFLGCSGRENSGNGWVRVKIEMVPGTI